MTINTNGPHGVTLCPVSGAASPYLLATCATFQAIFPDYAAYIPYLVECATSEHPLHPATINHLWSIQLEGQIIGVRHFCYVRPRNFGYGIFVGVLPAYRSLGIGKWLVEQTVTQLREDAARFGQPEPLGYCIEVEQVENATTPEEQEVCRRRLAFHQKNGAFILPVTYFEPPLPPGRSYTGAGVPPPKPMHLMFYPFDQRTTLEPGKLTAIVASLYLDVYQLSATTAFVRQALRSIDAGALTCI